MLPTHLVTFGLTAVGFTDISVDEHHAKDEGSDIKELTNWHPLCREDFELRDVFIDYYRERTSHFAALPTSIMGTYVVRCTKRK